MPISSQVDLKLESTSAEIINSICSDIVEQDSGFHHIFSYNNHFVELEDINLFLKISNTNFENACMRADKNNKTIIGFSGIKNDQRLWLIRCNSCGEEKESYMRFFYRCKSCSIISHTKSFEDFVINAKKKHGDQYIYNKENYLNRASKINIFCTKCNKYFNQSAKSHLKGIGCPICNESKGERAVRLYLDKIGISYNRHKKFKGLVYKSALEFDFYLYDLNLLIEFDGKQHFEVVNFSKDHLENVRNFELYKTRDQIKNNWTRDNKVPLLRIPYWDIDKVPELIDEYLSYHVKKRTVQLKFDFDIIL